MYNLPLFEHGFKINITTVDYRLARNGVISTAVSLRDYKKHVLKDSLHCIL